MTIATRTQTLNVAEIAPTKPGRVLSVTHINNLAESLTPTAFASAVVVRPIADGGEYSWELVAGFHRIAAAKAAGQIEVHAIVVENATSLELELIEIDENILRRPLTMAQEARALARRKEIYQQINPSTRRGGDRSAKNHSGSLKSFAQVTADATGRSVTAVNRAVARAEGITENALKMVQGTAIDTGGFLDRLAKVPPLEQDAFVTAALANPLESITTRIDVEADLARLRRCWSQSCAEARDKFLTEVAGSSVKDATAEP